MKTVLKENWIRVAVVASIFAVALLINVGLSLRNNNIIRETQLVIQESEKIIQSADEILTVSMHGLDLGVRGFGLTKDSKMLAPYEKSIKANDQIFLDLETALTKQGYPRMSDLKQLKEEVTKYIEFSNTMLGLVRDDNMTTFTELLLQDKGFEVWQLYTKFYEPLVAFQDDLRKTAYSQSSAAEHFNLVLQILIVVLTLPLLAVIILRLRKEQSERQALLAKVHENDKKYVFNPGTDKALNAEQIIETSIQNTRKASDFIKTLASGNYGVEWKGLNDQNMNLNQETLAGDLINMREKLKTVKVEDEKRNWMNERLAKFSEIVRNHQHEPKVLADKCVSFLTKYLKAQQGSLFVREGEEGEEYLNLASSYAFDKKKWIEKRIEIGNGLIGQAFLEGDITQLKDVPNGYTQITSGLGDATPKYIVIVPLKYDVHTVAVVELA